MGLRSATQTVASDLDGLIIMLEELLAELQRASERMDEAAVASAVAGARASGAHALGVILRLESMDNFLGFLIEQGTGSPGVINQGEGGGRG